MRTQGRLYKVIYVLGIPYAALISQFKYISNDITYRVNTLTGADMHLAFGLWGTLLQLVHTFIPLEVDGGSFSALSSTSISK